MIPQETVAEPEAKPEEAPAPSEQSMGTGIKGDGPADGFGLSGSGNGMTIGGGGGGRGGSRWGWYAGQVQTKIEEALRQNPRTRNASLRVVLRIWPDATGRIRRVELNGSTGDPSIDDLIKNDILIGFQFPEPPPADMRMPIVLRVTARRPL